MGEVIPIGEAAARRASRTGAPAPTGPLTAADVAAAAAAGKRLYSAREIRRLLGGRSADSLRRDRKAGMPSYPIGVGPNAEHRYLLDRCLEFYARRGTPITPPPADHDDAGDHPDTHVA